MLKYEDASQAELKYKNQTRRDMHQSSVIGKLQEPGTAYPTRLFSRLDTMILIEGSWSLPELLILLEDW